MSNKFLFCNKKHHSVSSEKQQLWCYVFFVVGNKKWLSEGLSQFFLLILSLIHSPNEILNSLPVPSSRHFPLHGTITFKVKKVLTYRFRFYTLLPIFYYLRFTNVLLQVDLAKDAFDRMNKDIKCYLWYV